MIRMRRIADSILHNRVFLAVVAGLVLNSVVLHAQVVQTHRYERDHRSSDEEFSVISLKEEGLVLLREKNKYEAGKKIWELVHLDTALQEQRTLELKIDHRYNLAGYEISPGHFYLLYRMGETTKNNLELIDVNLRKGEEENRYEIKPELDFKLSHFSKVGSNMVFGGYVSKEPAVILYTPESNVIKVIPGFFQKDNELVDLRVNENRTFTTVLMDRSQRSERKLVIKIFDEFGKLLVEDEVPVEDNKTLQASIGSNLRREDMILLGTWGDRQAKQSMGFFALPVDPFREQKIRYYYFGELAHYLDYLHPKRAQRIKKKTQDDLAAGREPSFASYVTPFRLEEHKDGFLLLAEVYTPSGNVNPYYNNPYYNPYYYNPYYFYNPFWPGYYPGMRTYRPPSYGSSPRNNEIKTHAAVVLAFNGSGSLLWDFSMKLEDIKKSGLEQASEYYYNGVQLVFLYKKESEIRIGTIDISDGEAVETVQKIKLNDPADELRTEREYEGGLQHWTGNAFYVWGYQNIRNATKKDRVRQVFYINKVEVR